MRSLFNFLCLCIVFLISGCGPGVKDGETPILNGYSYYDTGGNGKLIIFNNGEKLNKVIINPRVDNLLVESNNIVVTRRPVDTYVVDGVTNEKVSSNCEYWVIDTVTHVTTQVADGNKWPSLHCN